MTYSDWIVTLGTSLVGTVAGSVGCLAVLRRRALMGDLLAHAALPGLCLAFLVLGQRHFSGMLFGAFLTGLLGVGIVTLVCRWTRTKEDAAIGIVLSTFFGAGIVLSSIIQHQGGGAMAGLDSYIFGQAGGMIRHDVYAIASVAIVALIVLMLVFKEFKLLGFDPGFARSQGWPTLALDLLMMGLLALVTVVGLPAVGVVLMAALLIIPGATARFWTDRLGPMIVLAALLGAAMGAGGTLISTGHAARLLGFDPLAFGTSDKNLPPGPVIVLFGTTLFLLSVLFAPRRGVIARAWAGFRLRSKTARENFLRTLFELSEDRITVEPTTVTVAKLLEHRAWSPLYMRWLAWCAVRRGVLRQTSEGMYLTQSGIEAAGRLVRNHRLWELFLIEGANIAPDHVHRDADSIEHLLTPELIRQLEARIAEMHEAIPVSPHDLSTPERST